MSDSLRTFIMQSSVQSSVTGEDGGQEAPPNGCPYPTFLPQLPQPTPTPQTFLTGTPDTFLTLPQQMEGEGEALLGSGDGEGVTQGPLLYLNSSSALHVLVHHLPQAPHQPTPPQLVEEGGSQEQFVVVGALKHEEELAPPSPTTTCHVSVERIMDEELDGEAGDIYLPQPQDTPPTPQHHHTPVLTLVGDSGGGEPGDTTTGITLDTVPHITLEEIIQKFASSPDSPIDSLDESTTTITAITPITPINPIITPITPKKKQPPHPLPPVPPPSSRIKVEVLEDTKEGESTVVGEEGEGDDGCLYDVVVTYRCRVCGEVFQDKGTLLQHHVQRHRQTQGGIIKIRVTTTSPPTPGPDKKQREINIHSCRVCYKDFLTMRDYTEHFNKEHPIKKIKEGGPRQPRGTTVRYPAQPGMLVGHRKTRDIDHEEATGGGGGEGAVEGKRKIKAPQALQEQFWLQKQRQKPVCSVEVEKTYRCPVSTCKYKFSSEVNLEGHQECHGGGAGRGEERGFTCPHCAFRCDKWSVCQLHLWKTHSQDLDLLTCGICHAYKTCTQQRLLVHQKIHSDARDHLCKTCGKGFKQLAQLLNHQVCHITNPKDVPAWAERSYCEECHSWFKDRKALRMHTGQVHLKKKPHSCPHCSYKCSRKFDLTVHMRQHTGERPHRCPLCGWQASDHNTMRRHKLGHQDLKPFRCPAPLCQFETRHPAYFKRHMARRHATNDVPFKCQFCPLEIGLLQDYISHSMKHEKDLVEVAMKRGTEADMDTPGGTSGGATGGSLSDGAPTTIAITTDTNKMSNPICDDKMEVITINIDDNSASSCLTREDKSGGVDEAVVGGGEGEGEAVSLPQVVVSQSNGNFILGLPAEIAMTQSSGSCDVTANTSAQWDNVKQNTSPHPHHASPQHCNTIT